MKELLKLAVQVVFIMLFISSPAFPKNNCDSLLNEARIAEQKLEQAKHKGGDSSLSGLHQKLSAAQIKYRDTCLNTAGEIAQKVKPNNVKISEDYQVVTDFNPDTKSDGKPSSVDDVKDGCMSTSQGVVIDQQGCPENQLIVLSPRPQDVLTVQDKNGRLHVTVNVKVIAPKSDLYAVDLYYMGPDGMQTDGIAISKSGGTGKGSIVVSGPDTYILRVAAMFESGPPLEKIIRVKVQLSSPALNALKMLHRKQKISMGVARQKVQQAQSESVVSIPALQEIAMFVKESEKTILEIDQKLNTFEEGTSPVAVSPSIESSTEEEISKIASDNRESSDEIDKWKKWLQPLVDHVDALREPLVETLKWIDLDGITKINTPADKYQVIQSQKDNVFLVVNGKGKIVKQIDKRGTVAKVVDGSFLYFKYMMDPDPLQKAKDLYYSLADTFTLTKLIIMGNDKEWDKYLSGGVKKSQEAEEREKQADPGWKPLIFEGQYVEVSSKNTAYQFAVDPDTGLDLIRVFHGTVTVHAKTGQFEDQMLESNAVMTIDRHGIASRGYESNHQLVSQIERYESALSGANSKAQVISSDQMRFADVDISQSSTRNWNNTNWGGAHVMTTACQLDGESTRKIFIKLDTSNLGLTHTDLARAELEFDTAFGQGSGSIEVYRVLEPWDAGSGVHSEGEAPRAASGEITWKHQPLVDKGRVWARAEVSSTPGLIRFDITDLLRFWLSGPYPNHGMTLIAKAQGEEFYYRTLVSSDHPDEGVRPRLLIERGTSH